MDGINPSNVSRIRSNAMHVGMPQKEVKGKEVKEERIKAPEDKVSLQSLIHYTKEDVTPSGKVGVIIKAKNPEKLKELREKVAKDPHSRIKADLPLIDGFAAEIDPNAKGVIADLTKSVGDIKVFLDGKVKLIEPMEESISDEEAHIMMDVARKTMGIDKLWEKGYKGQGVTICVIDTGIAQHEDLKGRIVGFKDFVNGKDGAENAYDDQGHGTHCAGIAAGDGKASGGKYTGVAPEAKLVGVKVLNQWGSGSFSDVIKGIQWAVENKDKYHIDIISMSLGGRVTQSYEDDPVAQAVEAAVKKGIITLVAAGNSGPGAETIGTPANAPHVITVGALDDKGTVERDDDAVAYFSSRGPTKYDKLPKPDILTPGVRITAPNYTGGYTTKSGTSMATPFGAGLAALIKCAYPEVTPGELKGVAMGTADPLPNADHNTQGAGVFDAAEAVEKLTGVQINPPPPEENPQS